MPDLSNNGIKADLGPRDETQSAGDPNASLARDAAASSTRTYDTLTGGRVETSSPIREDDRRDDHSAPIGIKFRSLVLGSKNRRALSPEAQTYLETMKTFLKGYDVAVHEMPNDGVYLATNGYNSIGLIFNEVMRAPSVDDEFIPASAHIQRILGDELFRDKIKELGLRRGPDETIIIPKTDYIDTDAGASNAINRAVNVANIAGNSIRNVLHSTVDAEFSLEDMARYPIRLVTNQNEVANHLADCCPSGVLPYYQVGVAAEICTDQRVIDARERGRNFDRDQFEWQPLFVLGAATEFIDTRVNGPHRFLPIVTITACESTVKSLKMLPFMLSVAAEVFLQQGLFLEYFKNWGEDNPNPNLGQLVWDPRENRLAPPITNAREWDNFVQEALDRPVLAVDVRVGGWNHPSFECMLNPKYGIPLLQDELRALDPNSNLNLQNLVRDSVDFYCGNLIDNGITVDSRSIDYFKIVKTQQDPVILESFLSFTDNPEDRIKAIAACGWRPTSQGLARGIKTIDSLYDCWRLVLDATTVCDMFELSGALSIIRNLRQSSNLAFDFSMLRDIGSAYSRRERSFLRGDNRAYSNFNSYATNYWARDRR